MPKKLRIRLLNVKTGQLESPPRDDWEAVVAHRKKLCKQRDAHGDWLPSFDAMPPLDANEIAELRALLRESAPVPWHAEHRCCGGTENDDEIGGLGLDIEGPQEASNRGMFAKACEARLIVRAVSALPRLIREVELLRKRVAPRRRRSK